MGGYAQSDPLSETLGLPPEMAGQIRKRGIMSRLLSIGQDENTPLSGDFGTPGSWSDPNRTGQKLIDQVLNQAASAKQHGFEEWRHSGSQSPAGMRDPGVSAPDSTYSANGQARLVDNVQNHRIEDDQQSRHSQGQASSDDFVDQAPQMARASRMSLVEQVRQPEAEGVPRPISLKQQMQETSPDGVAAAQERLADAMKPHGIEALHATAHNPFLRGLEKFGIGALKGLDVAGSLVAPGAMTAVPGTRLNELVKRGAAQRGLNTAVENELKESQAEDYRSQAGVRNRQAALPQPDFKPFEGADAIARDANGGVVGVAGMNLKTNQPEVRPMPGGYSFGAQPQPKEGEMSLGERVPQLNQMLTQRYQVLNPGKPLPPQYSIPPNATQKDYDRIDKGLEAEERARGTLAQQQTANAMRQQAAALTQATRDQASADRDEKRKERTSQAVYGYDPATGTTRMMKEEEALNAGVMYQKVTTKQVEEDRQLTTRLSDVQQKIGRFEQAFQAGTLPASERYGISKVLADDKFKAGVFGSTLPVDFLNKLDVARQVQNLSPAAKKMLVAYYNAREAMTGYNRVLTGSGRSNEKTLELQLQTLPTPLQDAGYASEAFDQFKENLRIAGQGLPQIPGVTRPEQIEQNFSGNSNGGGGKQQGGAKLKDRVAGKVLVEGKDF